MGLVWPFLFWPKEVRSQHLQLLGVWSLACLGTAIFPLLDVNKQESVPTLYVFQHSLAVAINIDFPL